MYHEIAQPYVARDHSFRPRPARDGWWREDRKIGVAAREAIEADLAIPYGCKLTAQETWWRTMLGGRPEGVNNTDARARLERGDEIVEQGERRSHADALHRGLNLPPCLR